MIVNFFGILVDYCPFRLGALYAKHGARLLPSPPFACPLPHRAARDRARGAPRPHPSNTPARPRKSGALRAGAVGPGSPCGPLC